MQDCQISRKMSKSISERFKTWGTSDSEDKETLKQVYHDILRCGAQSCSVSYEKIFRKLLTDRLSMPKAPLQATAIHIKDFMADVPELHLLAALKVNSDLFEARLKEGSDPSARDELGFTPLRFAILSGDVRTVSLLLDYGADWNCIDHTVEYSSLMTAICSTKQMFDFVWKHRDKYDINFKNKYGHTAVHVAIDRDEDDLLEILLKENIIYEQGDSDTAAIPYAISNKKPKTLKRFLQRDANSATAALKDSQRFLKIAVLSGCNEVIKVVLKHLKIEHYEAILQAVISVFAAGCTSNYKDPRFQELLEEGALQKMALAILNHVHSEDMLTQTFQYRSIYYLVKATYDHYNNKNFVKMSLALIYCATVFVLVHQKKDTYFKDISQYLFTKTNLAQLTLDLHERLFRDRVKEVVGVIPVFMVMTQCEQSADWFRENLFTIRKCVQVLGLNEHKIDCKGECCSVISEFMEKLDKLADVKSKMFINELDEEEEKKRQQEEVKRNRRRRWKQNRKLCKVEQEIQDQPAIHGCSDQETQNSSQHHSCIEEGKRRERNSNGNYDSLEISQENHKVAKTEDKHHGNSTAEASQVPFQLVQTNRTRHKLEQKPQDTSINGCEDKHLNAISHQNPSLNRNRKKPERCQLDNKRIKQPVKSQKDSSNEDKPKESFPRDNTAKLQQQGRNGPSLTQKVQGNDCTYCPRSNQSARTEQDDMNNAPKNTAERVLDRNPQKLEKEAQAKHLQDKFSFGSGSVVSTNQGHIQLPVPSDTDVVGALGSQSTPNSPSRPCSVEILYPVLYKEDPDMPAAIAHLEVDANGWVYLKRYSEIDCFVKLPDLMIQHGRLVPRACINQDRQSFSVPDMIRNVAETILLNQAVPVCLAEVSSSGNFANTFKSPASDDDKAETTTPDNSQAGIPQQNLSSSSHMTERQVTKITASKKNKKKKANNNTELWPSNNATAAIVQEAFEINEEIRDNILPDTQTISTPKIHVKESDSYIPRKMRILMHNMDVGQDSGKNGNIPKEMHEKCKLGSSENLDSNQQRNDDLSDNSKNKERATKTENKATRKLRQHIKKLKDKVIQFSPEEVPPIKPDVSETTLYTQLAAKASTGEKVLNIDIKSVTDKDKKGRENLPHQTYKSNTSNRSKQSSSVSTMQLRKKDKDQVISPAKVSQRFISPKAEPWTKWYNEDGTDIASNRTARTSKMVVYNEKYYKVEDENKEKPVGSNISIQKDKQPARVDKHSLLEDSNMNNAKGVVNIEQPPVKATAAMNDSNQASRVNNYNIVCNDTFRTLQDPEALPENTEGVCSDVKGQSRNNDTELASKKDWISMYTLACDIDTSLMEENSDISVISDNVNASFSHGKMSSHGEPISEQPAVPVPVVAFSLTNPCNSQKSCNPKSVSCRQKDFIPACDSAQRCVKEPNLTQFVQQNGGSSSYIDSASTTDTSAALMKDWINQFSIQTCLAQDTESPPEPTDWMSCFTLSGSMDIGTTTQSVEENLAHRDNYEAEQQTEDISLPVVKDGCISLTTEKTSIAEISEKAQREYEDNANIICDCKCGKCDHLAQNNAGYSPGVCHSSEAVCDSDRKVDHTSVSSRSDPSLYLACLLDSTDFMNAAQSDRTDVSLMNSQVNKTDDLPVSPQVTEADENMILPVNSQVDDDIITPMYEIHDLIFNPQLEKADDIVKSQVLKTTESTVTSAVDKANDDIINCQMHKTDTVSTNKQVNRDFIGSKEDVGFVMDKTKDNSLKSFMDKSADIFGKSNFETLHDIPVKEIKNTAEDVSCWDEGKNATAVSYLPKSVYNLMRDDSSHDLSFSTPDASEMLNNYLAILREHGMAKDKSDEESLARADKSLENQSKEKDGPSNLAEDSSKYMHINSLTNNTSIKFSDNDITSDKGNCYLTSHDKYECHLDVVEVKDCVKSMASLKKITTSSSSGNNSDATGSTPNASYTSKADELVFVESHKPDRHFEMGDKHGDNIPVKNGSSSVIDKIFRGSSSKMSHPLSENDDVVSLQTHRTDTQHEMQRKGQGDNIFVTSVSKSEIDKLDIDIPSTMCHLSSKETVHTTTEYTDSDSNTINTFLNQHPMSEVAEQRKISPSAGETQEERKKYIPQQLATSRNVREVFNQIFYPVEQEEESFEIIEDELEQFLPSELLNDSGQSFTDSVENKSDLQPFKHSGCEQYVGDYMERKEESKNSVKQKQTSQEITPSQISCLWLHKDNPTAKKGENQNITKSKVLNETVSPLEKTNKSQASELNTIKQDVENLVKNEDYKDLCPTGWHSSYLDPALCQLFIPDNVQFDNTVPEDWDAELAQSSQKKDTTSEAVAVDYSELITSGQVEFCVTQGRKKADVKYQLKVEEQQGHDKNIQLSKESTPSSQDYGSECQDSVSSAYKEFVIPSTEDWDAELEQTMNGPICNTQLLVQPDDMIKSEVNTSNQMLDAQDEQWQEDAASSGMCDDTLEVIAIDTEDQDTSDDMDGHDAIPSVSGMSSYSLSSMLCQGTEVVTQEQLMIRTGVYIGQEISEIFSEETSMKPVNVTRVKQADGRQMSVCLQLQTARWGKAVRSFTQNAEQGRCSIYGDLVICNDETCHIRISDIGEFGMLGTRLSDGKAMLVKKLNPYIGDKIKLSLELLPHLEHPNVLPYLTLAEEEHRRWMYLAGELCEFSLQEYVHSMQLMKEQDRVALQNAIGRDIMSGLAYLHSQAVIHGRLKPTNVLIKRSGTAVLSDYGLVESRHNSLIYVTEGNFRIWFPSDHLEEYIHESGFKGDIQVAGMLLFYLWTLGDHPFRHGNWDIQVNILGGHRSNRKLSAELDHLLDAMLAYEPLQRPDACQVLNHMFFWPPERKFHFLMLVGHELLSQGYARESDIIRRINSIDLEIQRGKPQHTSWQMLIDRGLLEETSRLTGLRFLPTTYDLILFMHFAVLSMSLMSKMLRDRIGQADTYFLPRFPLLPIKVLSVLNVVELSHILSLQG